MIHESSMSRRDERRRIRRDELLDAALEIVAQQGLEGLSVQAWPVDRSLRRGHVPVLSLPRGRLVALQCRVLSELGDRLEAAASRASVLPAPERWLQSADRHHLPGVRPPPTTSLRPAVLDLADPRSLLSEEDAGVVGAAMQRLLAVVEEAIQRGQDAGALSAGCPQERCLLLWVSTRDSSSSASWAGSATAPADGSAARRAPSDPAAGLGSVRRAGRRCL